MTFNIKVVAERTGVSVHTLRQWERRYGVPSPGRAGNRYRLYDESDIADVLAIKRQIENGISPAQAGALLRQHHQARSFTARVPGDSQLISHQLALETAFGHSDETAARQLLDEAFALFSIEQVATQIIQPAMESLGTKWMRGELSVAQEHLASNLVRQKLIALIQAQAASISVGFHVVAANAPEEEHELGLLTLVLLARHQGWRVTYLGQRTPLTHMAQYAREHKADWMVVSVTTILGLASLIPWLAKTSRPSVPVAFGGRLFEAIPHLRGHLPGRFLGEDINALLNPLTTQHVLREPWAPDKKSLKAAMMLRGFRLKIASEAVTQLGEQARADGWGTEALTTPTLYLIDLLACAMAFDVPELMEAHNEWLHSAMPSLRVQPQMISKYLHVFKRTVEKNLSEDWNKFVEQLLSRLQN